MAPRHVNRDIDDDAPWLAEAAPAPGRTEVSRRSLFWTLFLVLVLATIAAVGLVFLMAKKDGGSTQGYMNAEQAPVITAEPGPYKVRPADPAGMRIDGLDGTMYSAGEGIDQGSAIDPSLAPEAPLPRPGSEAAAPNPAANPLASRPAPETGPPRNLLPGAEAPPAATPSPPVAAPPAPAAAPAVAKPAVAKPLVTLPPASPAIAKPPAAAPAAKPPAAAPAARPAAATATPNPAAKPGSVQLGAFSSEDKADAAWATLAARHGLSGKRVTAVTSGDKTLYRLRAASPDPAATCATLKAAGDACAIVE